MSHFSKEENKNDKLSTIKLSCVRSRTIFCLKYIDVTRVTMIHEIPHETESYLFAISYTKRFFMQEASTWSYSQLVEILYGGNLYTP